jgi:hypothetical protein
MPGYVSRQPSAHTRTMPSTSAGPADRTVSAAMARIIADAAGRRPSRNCHARVTAAGRCQEVVP